MSKIKPVGLVLLLLVTLIGSSLLTLQANPTTSVVQSTATIQMSITPQVFHREVTEGYNLADESEMIRQARESLGITEMIEEKIYYVRAGYWSESRGRGDYLMRPNHPIFVYTMKGTLIGFEMYGGGDYSFMITGTPPPTLPPPEGATIAFDAVTGQVISYHAKFISDIDSQLSQQDHADYMATFVPLMKTMGYEIMEITDDVRPTEDSRFRLPTVTP
jgi:hypothetical protein